MTTIWAKDLQSEKNINVAFALSKKVNVKNMVLNLVAINVYRLYVNGDLVGYGPARASHGYVRMDTYKLEKYIKDGNLNIVVEVFGANVNSYYLADEPPFFGAEIIDGNNTVYSTKNGDFKAFLLNDRVQKVQRYSFQRPFSECYVMKKCRTEFYNGDFSVFPEVEAQVVPCNKIIDRYAPYPSLDRVGFVELSEFGAVFIDESLWKWDDRCLHPNAHPNETLKGYAKSELDICISDEASVFSYKKSNEGLATNKLDKMGYHLYDFGRTITGFFNIELTANEDTDLYILWDEIDGSEENKVNSEKNICFYRNTCCNVIKYTLKAGEYHLLAFEPTSARYAKIIVTRGTISLKNFSMIAYENPDVKKITFESNDDNLNAIVEAAKNTLAQNAVDVLTDCPSRERAGWLCDAFFSAKAEKLMTGGNAVEKSLLESYILAPQLEALPNGMLPMCYPADHNDGVYIPNWAMWFVVELYGYYKRTGDSELVIKAKAKVYKLIDFFKKYINSDGLLENLESWVFIEWSKCNDADYIVGVNYPSNMLYSAMLAKAGELFNDEELIAQSQSMKKTIIKQSYNGEFFEDNRVRENGELISKNHLTETCQYYAFYFDIAKKEDFHILFDTMVKKFGPKRDFEKVYSNIAKSNAIVGNYLRLELLLQNNYYDQVLEECKDFFTKMAQRTSTLWEHSFAHDSLNHGFASVAGNYIIEAITGLVDVDLTRKTVILSKPVKGYSATVSVPVPDGKVILTVKNGEVKAIAPEGYQVETVCK